MSRRIDRTIPLILLPLISGCISQSYVPNRPPVPLITHQGELSVSGGVHFPFASGYDCQVVYAPWNHISTFAALQFDRGYGVSLVGHDSSDYNNRFFEIGLGYFDSIHWAQYEVYLHAGLGRGANHQSAIRYYLPYSSSSAYTDTTSLSVFRLGIQQNIGIEGSLGSIGGGLGLGYEHLSNLNRAVTNYEFGLSGSGNSISSVRETSPESAFYAEPIIFCSVGGPVAVDGVDLLRLNFLFEVWWTYRTNSYPAFGSWNESLTLSLVFQ